MVKGVHSDYASDRRYPDRNEEVMFNPFPKPKKNFAKCRIKKIFLLNGELLQNVP